jgi:hypothetical protein
MIAPCEIQPFHPFAPVIRMCGGRAKASTCGVCATRFVAVAGGRGNCVVRIQEPERRGTKWGRVKIVNTSIRPFMREMPGSGKLLEEIAD